MKNKKKKGKRRKGRKEKVSWSKGYMVYHQGLFRI